MKASELMEETLLDSLASFYKQSAAEQQHLLKRVLASANANPTAFRRLVEQQRFDSTADVLANNLPIFYEALAADLSNWADFFLREAQRLLALARTSEAPQKILSYLDEFGFIKAADFKNRAALLAILSRELDNENPVFRYYAAWLMPDFIQPDDSSPLTKLRRLLHDPNWRIRYQVYQNLKYLNLLAAQDTLSWVDRLRAWIWSPHEIA